MWGGGEEGMGGGKISLSFFQTFLMETEKDYSWQYQYLTKNWDNLKLQIKIIFDKCEEMEEQPHSFW